MNTKDEINTAVALLKAGKLVAFPTETVYGLGADASNKEAVLRIFKAKNRPVDHPLIVHIPSAVYLSDWAETVSDEAWALAEVFWPGPLTLILPRAKGVHDCLTGSQNTVGVRVPAHPLAKALLEAFADAGNLQEKVGIAAPSANRFGRISPTQAIHVREELGDAVDFILDGGACEVGIESTILDLSQAEKTPRILRLGNISPEHIADVLGKYPECPTQNNAQNTHQNTPRVSGNLDAHYAPKTRLLMLTPEKITQISPEQLTQCAWLIFSEHLLKVTPKNVQIHMPKTPEAYAHKLYAALRAADALNQQQIIVEAIPDTAEWAAINDRLRRAITGSTVK